MDGDDGTCLFPARVVREGRTGEAEVERAEAHFRDVYRGRGTISLEAAKRLSEMPIPNAVSLRTWREVREDLEWEAPSAEGSPGWSSAGSGRPSTAMC